MFREAISIIALAIGINATLPSPRETYAEALADSEVQCLSVALWKEARGEPIEGWEAVAEVILYRRDDGRYPDSVCGVIEDRKHGPQFPWFKGWPVARPDNPALYRAIYEFAHAKMRDWETNGPRIFPVKTTRFCSLRYDPCRPRGGRVIGAHTFWSE